MTMDFENDSITETEEGTTLECPLPHDFQVICDPICTEEQELFIGSQEGESTEWFAVSPRDDKFLAPFPVPNPSAFL